MSNRYIEYNSSFKWNNFNSNSYDNFRWINLNLIMIQIEVHRIEQKSELFDIKYLCMEGTIDDLDKFKKKINYTTLDDKKDSFEVNTDPNQIYIGIKAAIYFG